MGPDTGGGTLPAAQQPWPGGRPAGRYLHAEHCQTGQGIQVLKFSDLVFPQEQTLQAGQGVDVLNGLWEGQGSGEPPEADWPQRAGSSCLGVSPALLGRHIPLGRLSREPSLERGGNTRRLGGSTVTPMGSRPSGPHRALVRWGTNSLKTQSGATPQVPLTSKVLSGHIILSYMDIPLKYVPQSPGLHRREMLDVLTLGCPLRIPGAGAHAPWWSGPLSLCNPACVSQLGSCAQQSPPGPCIQQPVLSAPSPSLGSSRHQ